jgi:hypothetical protein
MNIGQHERAVDDLRFFGQGRNLFSDMGRVAMEQPKLGGSASAFWSQIRKSDPLLYWP